MKTHTVKARRSSPRSPTCTRSSRSYVRITNAGTAKATRTNFVGEAIPQLARIVAVADTFDAMTSNRPYHPDKKGKPPEVAFEEVRKQAGFQFDPQCAKAFLEIQKDILESMSSNRQTAFLQVR